MNNFFKNGLFALLGLLSSVSNAQDCGPWNSGSLFPHATNCSKFFICDYGLLIEQDCPAGLHFNPASEVCDWPENAGCTACGNICMGYYNHTVNQTYQYANTSAFVCLWNVGYEVASAYIDLGTPMENLISIYNVITSYPTHMGCIQSVFDNMDTDLAGSYMNLSDCLYGCP